MSNIDWPAIKDTLWHNLRSDLCSFIPQFKAEEILLCPTCCRRIKFDEFSLEHIVPKQALALDPADVRQNVTENQRASLTLLCQKSLILNGEKVSGKGCNSWKGKYYDPFLRRWTYDSDKNDQITTRHQIALFSAGYLGLFQKFGYQITLSQAGRLMRSQFFHPDSFLEQIPLTCQMSLSGPSRTKYSDKDRSYWSEPFKFTTKDNKAYGVLRSTSFILPLSHDPTQPLARQLRYVPPKYKLRPDLTTFFE